MAHTIVIPSVKDVTTSVKERFRKTVGVAELTVLSGVKRVSTALADKADAVSDKIDDHANKKYNS